MNISKYLKISLGVAVMIATQVSCIHDDNWDAPEIVCNNKFDAPTISMADFVKKLPANVSSITIPNGKDDAPVIFDAYVVSSDEAGNFYKTISFQDSPVNPTIGLQVGINKSMNYVDFPVGAHIRIKANGLVLGKLNDVIQIGTPDPNYAIGRIPQSLIGRYMSGVCQGNGLEIVDIVPTEVTLLQITQTSTGYKFINTLVKVKDVQFDDGEIGKPLMDKDISGTYIDTNRVIVDATGRTANVRTDGYFKNTAYTIPNKSGDITFVVSKYGTGSNPWQNIIRDISDINFTKDLPSKKLLVEGFANLTNNGWTAYNVAGAAVWGTTTFGNPAPSAYISGLNSVNEDWLISKSISLANLGEYSKSVYFSFETDGRYPGNPLEAYITTDPYSGGDPKGLNWIKLPAIFDTDMNAFAGWVSSGKIDLKGYLDKDIRVAFKYTNSSSSTASAWEVDNVKIIAEK